MPQDAPWCQVTRPVNNATVLSEFKSCRISFAFRKTFVQKTFSNGHCPNRERGGLSLENLLEIFIGTAEIAQN